MVSLRFLCIPVSTTSCLRSYRYCKNKPYPKSRFCRGVPGKLRVTRTSQLEIPNHITIVKRFYHTAECFNEVDCRRDLWGVYHTAECFNEVDCRRDLWGVYHTAECFNEVECSRDLWGVF